MSSNRRKLASSTERCRGVIRGNTVVLEKQCELPEGTEVTVTLYPQRAGTPEALLAALRAGPRISREDAELLERAIRGEPIRTNPRKRVKKARAKSRP